ncbi:MAG: copper resistance protein CopC [Alphaproteobacteria bacterium]|nr:copper resistance protein CopC [Alphaproteobacteria bacterium]
MKTIVSALLLSAWAHAAYACPTLESAEPRVGSVASGEVSRVALHFSGAIIPASSTLSVSRMPSQKVSIGQALADSKDDRSIAIAVAAPLAPGQYKVEWRVLCECGSFVPGSYKFTVR